MSKKAIIKDGDIYSFYDDIYSRGELEALKKGLGYTENRRVLGVIDLEESVGYHACNKSQVWEDITGYIDELQNEKELEENRLYIVTYYKYLDGDLEHCTDFGITKDQIIKNVIEQKYLEGADYFLMDSLETE